MLDMPNTLKPGQVVRFARGGARRRYVIVYRCRYGVGTEHEFTDLNLLALSGGLRGSAPGGVRDEELVLDEDQKVEFTGSIAHKLQGRYNRELETAAARARFCERKVGSMIIETVEG